MIICSAAIKTNTGENNEELIIRLYPFDSKTGTEVSVPQGWNWVFYLLADSRQLSLHWYLEDKNGLNEWICKWSILITFRWRHHFAHPPDASEQTACLCAPPCESPRWPSSQQPSTHFISWQVMLECPPYAQCCARLSAGRTGEQKDLPPVLEKITDLLGVGGLGGLRLSKGI